MPEPTARRLHTDADGRYNRLAMRATACRRAIVAVLVVLTASGVATAQPLTVDMLLARVVTEPNPHPYTMTADFTTRVTLNMVTGKLTVQASGALVESRTANGEPRRRKATVSRVDVPFLLRPFSNSIRQTVTDLVEAERKLTDFVPMMDIFIQEELNGNRFLLGGVRQDIVTEVINKQRQTTYMKDPTFRRAIARWLFAPSQRASIARAGDAYAVSAVVDDAGLVHQLTLFYDWGTLGSRISFVTVGGRAFWREVNADTSSDVSGIGRVEGKMVLQFSNHCLNCPPR